MPIREFIEIYDLCQYLKWVNHVGRDKKFDFHGQIDKKYNFMNCKMKKIWNASRICVSSLRRGHANLLCIVPILVYVLREQYTKYCRPFS